MAKPVEKINWTLGNAGARQEPTNQKKIDGFFPAERPSRKTMNWLFYNVFEWLEYLELTTDAYISTLKVFDALVGSGGIATHATLQAAHDDVLITSGSSILVLESAALDSVVNITKANIEIVFKPNVTYSKGGGAPQKAISVGSSADGFRMKFGRFAGFNGGGESGIEIASDADFCMLLNQRFANNTKDIEDNGNATISILGSITE